MTARRCSTPDCGLPVLARGFCQKHYREWRCQHPEQVRPYSPRGTSLPERLWSKVDRRGPDDCWPWTAGTNRFGYGVISVQGKARQASRVALELTLGRPLRYGRLACHHCDNPPCCNPRHLYEGTKLDNYLDRGGSYPYQAR